MQRFAGDAAIQDEGFQKELHRGTLPELGFDCWFENDLSTKTSSSKKVNLNVVISSPGLVTKCLQY